MKIKEEDTERIRLSAKQLEVVKELYSTKSTILFMKGLTEKCYISNSPNPSYSIPIPTMFALQDKGMIEKIRDEDRVSEYHLTKLGKANAIINL